MRDSITLTNYQLVRLLSPVLCQAQRGWNSRVIKYSVSLFCVSPACRDPKALFTDWRSGFYEHNKLANVYTAFELQRR